MALHAGLHGQSSQPSNVALAEAVQISVLTAVPLPNVQQGNIRAGWSLISESVGGQKHDIMVAQQRLYAAARALGLSLQTHEEIYHADAVRPSVYIVANKPERRLAARPCQVVADQPGGLEQPGQRLNLTVDIADDIDRSVRHITSS